MSAPKRRSHTADPASRRRDKERSRIQLSGDLAEQVSFSNTPYGMYSPTGGSDVSRDFKRDEKLGTGQMDLIDQLGDRDALFALLSRLMPWAQAALASASVIGRYGSLADVLAAPEEELAAIEPLGAGAAGVLKVVHATALRLIAAPLKKGPVFSRWPDLEAYLTAAMAREPIEQARVLFLDARNRLIADEVVATGGPRGVTLEFSSIARRAVQLHATALILVHNHPSGDSTPSLTDVEMTRKIRGVLSPLGIVVHDHLIVARAGMASLRRLGVL